MRFAFAGFRHGHILEVHAKAGAQPGCSVAAASEEDAETRASIAAKVKVTHGDYRKMLDEIPCDAVAVGDYFGRRGEVAIEALRRGKHVLSDKPLCTRLEELEEIEALAKEKRLAVGCQLDMPQNPRFVLLRETIAAGTLGEIHQIAFGGQHPLLWGSRAPWYFEPGKHGGTINDIAIHAIHFLPKLTGLTFKSVVAARAWNAFAKDVPHFMDSAQMLLTMSNGCGVVGDVSYAMPSGCGYKMPQYWRITVYGSKGVAETGPNYDHVFVCLDADKEPRKLPLRDRAPGGYFESFLAEASGRAPGFPFRAEVLQASRTVLKIQQAADRGLQNAEL
ncbi:MAG: Gfo/Idh/MocA family oxidoreductase [Planctomycetota bacterium]|nr:Gfo/Idh/MocA family oxidoreductase [Planctomycetota bacterium]